jgi:hypothetical protein
MVRPAAGSKRSKNYRHVRASYTDPGYVSDSFLLHLGIGSHRKVLVNVAPPDQFDSIVLQTENDKHAKEDDSTPPRFSTRMAR